MAGVGVALVRGAIAGLAGTAVMTVAQQVEMSRTGRAPSLVPGRVAARLLRRNPGDAKALSLPMHWAHGTTMGTVRALITRAGLRGLPANMMFFAVLWFGDVVLYKALGIADWPWRWTPGELATDAGHKALYAVSTGTVTDALIP